MKTKSLFITVILFFSVVFLTIFLFPKDYDNVIKSNFLIDSTSLIIIVLLLGKYNSKHDFNLFDPIWVISFMYIMMYFVTPIYDLIIEKHTWYGYSVIQYGVKSSLIALAGYLSLYFVYSNRIIIRRRNGYFINYNYTNDFFRERNVSVAIIVVMYIVCFAANAFYMIMYYGMSFKALLSFGMLKGADVEATSAEIGFISMLSYSLPTVVLLYFEYGKNKLFRILFFIPMFVMQVTRGFRFLVIQIIITFISYYYIRNNKKPKYSSLLIVLAVLMVFVLGMTLFRETVRWGGSIDFSIINSEKLRTAFDNAIWDNFRIYNNYYGIVGAVPSRYDYVFGREIILGTIVMVIPRILWPGKISSSANAGLRNIIGANIASGQASPNISEYYYACGAIGVVICMGIYASIMKKARLKMSSKDPLDIMAFSVLLGSNIQLIIRSYTPSNFWYVIFALLPIWIIKTTSQRMQDM